MGIVKGCVGGCTYIGCWCGTIPAVCIAGGVADRVVADIEPYIPGAATAVGCAAARYAYSGPAPTACIGCCTPCRGAARPDGCG